MKDRLNDQERRISELSRHTAGIPVRYASGGGSGSGDFGNATMMVLTEAMDAASGDISSIVPATALAQSYQTDPDTGARTPTDDDPITIYNYDTCQGYLIRTAVWVGSEDGSDIIEIISAACCQLGEAP